MGFTWVLGGFPREQRPAASDIEGRISGREGSRSVPTFDLVPQVISKRGVPTSSEASPFWTLCMPRHHYVIMHPRSFHHRAAHNLQIPRKAEKRHQSRSRLTYVIDLKIRTSSETRDHPCSQKAEPAREKKQEGGVGRDLRTWGPQPSFPRGRDRRVSHATFLLS